MHQPDYRVAGRFQRPWVYLHALAGYTDMAAALEGEPAARAVVNFTPVLLDQLDDYARRLKRWRDTGPPPRDPLLDALIRLPPPGPGLAELVPDLFAPHPQFGGPIAMRRLGSSSRSCAARAQQAFPTGFASTCSSGITCPGLAKRFAG